jgi:hypothetical protein
MPDTTTIDTTITGVTVFRDGARIERRGTATLDPGRQQVLIGGLPASLDPSSVRVVADGEGLSLLEIEVQRRYRTDPLRDDAARLIAG